MTESGSAHTELVRKAQAGDSDSLATLAELARERVYAYIHRVTLNEDKSQDLTQETLVAVLQSIGTLRHVERFWPWVFRIATNTIRQHFRRDSRRKTVQMPEITETQLPARPDGHGDGLASLAGLELAQITREAMDEITERYRMVLALRFFEDLPHSDVARAMECSELAARTTLFRAKHALVKALKRRGIRRSALVAALAAFGQATVWPSSATAATVSTAAVAETMLTGLLTVKLKVAAVVAVALLAVTGWHLVPAWQGVQPPGASASPETIRAVHFVRHSRETNSDDVNFDSSQSKGAYEQWYDFPEGLDGPFRFRMQRWDPTQTNKLCWWVENGDANYYVYTGDPTVYIRNYKLYYAGHGTMCLPTDSPELASFIRSVEGEPSGAMVDGSGLTYQRDPATGFVASHADNRFADSIGVVESVYDYSDPDPSLFDAPIGMKVVDERDEMHKRGWTYFRVDGRLGDRTVSGSGRLPFVYNASAEHFAWLKLSVDGQRAAVDTGRQAYTLDGDGQVIGVYPGGSLFKGLPRPWMGFHTLDTIRRDAADERIWFATDVVEPRKKVEVGLVDDHEQIQYMMRYTVDMAKDVLVTIDLWRGPDGLFEEHVGELSFCYDCETDEPGDAFVIPEPMVLSEAHQPDQGTIFWPIQLLTTNAPAQEDDGAN